MRRNDKRSSHTVNLHNKGGKSSEFKSHWLRFHRAVCPPLNLLPLQSNIHGTSTLVQAVWGEAVPKSLVLVGLWSDESVHTMVLYSAIECGTSHTAPLEETFHTRTAVPRHRIMKIRQMPIWQSVGIANSTFTTLH